MIFNSYFIQFQEEDLKLKVIKKQNKIGHKNITALEDFFKEIMDRNDPIPNRKVNMLKMRQTDEEKPSYFFHRVGIELDRANMETMTSPELHSLITIMGLKDSILYKDLTQPRDPLQKDLISNRELLANMYQQEKHGRLNETVHPTKVAECQQSRQRTELVTDSNKDPHQEEENYCVIDVLHMTTSLGSAKSQMRR